MGCNNCLAWILLTSYAGLVAVGSLGLYLASINFGYEEPLPPTPPPSLGSNATTTTTTTTPDPYGNNYYSRNSKVPEAYKEYVYATWHYAKATSDPRLYVVLPCVASIVVGFLVLICSLWSRKFFCFTFSLYSSLCLWALTLTWIIVYQSILAWDPRMDLDNAEWVILTHVVLMLLLSAQILLCVWELRLKRAGWPTINFRSLFTAEILLITARVTLTVFTLKSLSDSQVFRGFRGKEDPRYASFEAPNVKYPLTLTIACCSTACCNAVATFETMLSILLGKLHPCMTATTTLLSGLCCVTVAVLCSPVLVKVHFTPRYMYMDSLYFSIALSVVTFLHFVACVGFPKASRTPPELLVNIGQKLKTAILSVGTMAREQTWNSSMPVLPQINRRSHLIINLISAIFALLSIIIIGAVWGSPLYRAWGAVLVLCANSATLTRTLPPVVMELGFKQIDNIPPYQRLMGMSLECAALLVGASVMCARSYEGGEVFCGVMNLLFLVFEIFIIVQMLRGKFASEEGTEGIERLEENMEVSCQNSNDEQNHREVLA